MNMGKSMERGSIIGVFVGGLWEVDQYVCFLLAQYE